MQLTHLIYLLCPNGLLGDAQHKFEEPGPLTVSILNKDLLLVLKVGVGWGGAQEFQVLVLVNIKDIGIPQPDA